MLSFLTCLLLSPSAQAVPLQITQQGRMIDASGAAVDGSQIVVFRVYDAETGGNQLWEEYLTVQFNNGYYATVLGVDESGNPLDSETLSLYPVFLEIQLNSNPPMSPRQAINSAPYAQIAGVAESVEGGTVNASEVQIGSSPVIDGNRNWVGEPITVDWSSVQNVPSEFQDGDNDTQLSESEVENYVTNGGLSLHEDTTLNGQEILTLGNDSDTLANISCSDGDVPKWDGVVGQWDCGFDNDTLADLNCAAGELAKFDGSSWSCGEDIDTVLDADTVISYVEQNSLSIPAGSQIDGADILTSADTLEPEWTNIQNRPNGLDDGDDDTQLSQSEVVGYVESSSVNLASGSQVNSRNIVGQPSVCSGGQVLVYNASSNDWECGDDTDTTLTESEMQTMIEAMTLNFQNRPQVNGADVLTTDSTLDPMKIDASGSTEGQVLTSDGTTLEWGDSSGGCNVVSKHNGNTVIDCQGTLGIVKGSFTIYTDIALGEDHTCGLDNSGKIYCWGSGDEVIENVPSGSFSSITSGWHHSCAISNTEEIKCWGNDYSGIVSGSPTGSFVQIDSGRSHSCALSDIGEIKCWGNDNYGEVSNSPLGNFTDISSANGISCALDSQGLTTCWGNDHYGQVSNVPSTQFISIAVGNKITCGLLANGSVECWGTDGNGTIANAPSSNISSIDGGWEHFCSRSNNNELYCWGQNNNDRLNFPSGSFSNVSTGGSHSCGILTSGLVTCWGSDEDQRVSGVK